MKQPESQGVHENKFPELRESKDQSEYSILDDVEKDTDVIPINQVNF